MLALAQAAEGRARIVAEGGEAAAVAIGAPRCAVAARQACAAAGAERARPAAAEARHAAADAIGDDIPRAGDHAAAIVEEEERRRRCARETDLMEGLVAVDATRREGREDPLALWVGCEVELLANGRRVELAQLANRGRLWHPLLVHDVAAQERKAQSDGTCTSRAFAHGGCV